MGHAHVIADGGVVIDLETELIGIECFGAI
jgi:hypothetical protein